MFCLAAVLSFLLSMFGLFLDSPWKRALSHPVSRAASNQSPTVPPPAWEGGVSSFRTECITLCSQPQCVLEGCLCSQSRWLLKIWCLYYWLRDTRQIGSHIIIPSQDKVSILSFQRSNIHLLLCSHVFFHTKTHPLFDWIVVITFIIIIIL